MSSKNIHVVPHPEGWAVRREGSTRPSVVLPTQSQASEKARDQAIRVGGEVLVHGENGRIRERSSYGDDPCPPKDKT